MKKPKKVLIAGRDWNVKWNKKLMDGASFNSYTSEIIIGDDGKDGDLDMYLHEVLEAILQCRAHRYHVYCDTSNEKKLFSFDHAEFTNIVKDLAIALKPIIKDK